jgi:4-hydroxy-3-polyprenylbenzoate decarboxylase
MDKPERADVWKALETAGASMTNGKICIAVDPDIDPYDADAVIWAMGLRMNPKRDCQIFPQPGSNQDLSLAPPEEMEKKDTRFEEMPQGYRLLIDATMKWPYPPVSLPKREFMEKALSIWKEEGLPELKLKEPWYGYNLGFWPDEYAEQAELALKGEHYKVGEMLALKRTKL